MYIYIGRGSGGDDKGSGGDDKGSGGDYKYMDKIKIIDKCKDKCIDKCIDNKKYKHGFIFVYTELGAQYDCF